MHEARLRAQCGQRAINGRVVVGDEAAAIRKIQMAGGMAEAGTDAYPLERGGGDQLRAAGRHDAQLAALELQFRFFPAGAVAVAELAVDAHQKPRSKSKNSPISPP